MKKIILLTITLLFSIAGYSQFPTPGTEGFENTTGPDLAAPTTPSAWTLGTGATANQWAVFDNGVGLTKRWNITTVTANVYAGLNSAYMDRENIGLGNTSEDYLATPLLTVPTNGQLRFWTRSTINGANGTEYLIKVYDNAVATAGAQTTTANYTLTPQQWTEATLSTTYNVYEEKVVDLSAFAGHQVYIAFVMRFTQPTASLGGDRWLIDDVRLVQQCLAPTGQTATPQATTANLSWTDTNGSTSWEVEVLPATGTPTGTGIVVTTNPYQATGLTANTAYQYYVRSICSGGLTSVWVGPFNFSTTVAPIGCGGNFVDSGGTTGSYSNSENITTLICPSNPTDLVTVTFTSFNTESGFDFLKIYDGSSTAGTLLGTYSGTTLPPAATSSVPGGCLTFVFTSDSSVSAAGWVANITCAPAPTCPKPTALATSGVTSSAGTLTWTNNSTATQFEVLALPCASPAPTATSTGTIITPTTNTYTFTGLTSDTCYTLYVRAVCSSSDSSAWSTGINIQTQVTPPACGGTFTDPGGANGNYANSSNVTTTICPTNGTDLVTVSFTAFNLENNFDFLKVYAGIDATGPLLGNFTGTTIPADVVSTAPGGCLTFVFTSDGSVSAAGWVANVTCAPAPTCPKPTALVTSAVTSSAGTLTWTNNSTATQFEVLALPCASPAPTATSTGTIITPTTPNTYTFTGLTADTCYTLYVRAVCSSSDSSAWSTGINIQTQITPPACGGTFTDPGGANGNYANNANVTTTICPTNGTDLVTVSFTAFNLENNFDFLKVYAGIGTTGPLLGNFTGTTIPADIVSPTPGGCLTFVFTSDGITTAAGWVANVTCAPPPTCPKVTNVIAAGTSNTTATVSWTENGSATQWEIIVTPAPSTAPTAASTGIIVSTNPATLQNLTQGVFYDVYVRPICSATDIGLWTNATSLYITPPLPTCAGVNLTVATTSPGVIDLCPNSCVNLSASYTNSYTTSSYSVSSIPYAPLYPYTGGTQVSVNTDDVWSGDIAIPFKFCFYGNTYNAINIGSNGVVTFDTHTANSNCPWAFTATIPNTTFPIRNAIYAPYQDINPATLTAPAQPNINYQVLGVAPCRAMVINFSRVAQFSCGVTVGLQTSQLVLYETSNIIDINIKDRTSCTGWNSGSGVVGIQNGAGTNAVVPPGRNTGTWSATNESWRFMPTGPSNVTFAWLQNGSFLSSNTNVTVCPTSNTNMTAQATYTACDGTTVVKTQDVLLNLTTITPTFNPIGPLCQNSVAPMLPTMSTNASPVSGTWSPATIDTSIVGSTVYTFTPNSGQCGNPTTMTITIAPYVVPTFNSIPSFCAGTTAPVLPTTSTNGITGTWSPAVVNNTAVGTTTYTFTPSVTQCATTTTMDITVNASTTPVFTSPAPICSGSLAPVLPSTSTNGITGTWSPATVSNTASGTYTFTPDAGQCSAPVSINVTVNSVVAPTVVVVTQPTCATPTGTIQVTAPVSSVTTLPTDLFMSEVTDSNAGSLSYIELYNGTGSTINLSSYSIKTAGNGGAYSFTLPLNNVNLASGSTYVVALGNDNYCPSTPGADGSLAAQTNVSGSVNFNVNGNDHFGLFNGSTLIDSWGIFGSNNWAPSSVGTEGADFRRKNSVVAPNTVYNNNDWDVFDYAGTGTTACSNNDYSNIGSFTALTTNNYQYNVDGGTYQSNPVFTGLTPGSHVVTVLDTVTGCVSTGVTVVLNQAVLNPSVTTFSYTTPVCINVSSTLTPDTTATGFTTGGTYSATPAGLSINSGTGVVDLTTSIPGTYTITYSVNANSTLCLTAGNSQFTLVINSLPTVTVNSPSVCQGSAATVTATAGTTGTYSYVWTVPSGATNPGNVATFTTSVAGTYSVVITNSTTGCSSLSASGTVTINPTPTVTVNSSTVCQGQSATVTATPGSIGSYNYVWTVPTGASNPGNVATFTTTTAGTYNVVITNTVTGCSSASASGIVTVNANPTVTVTGDTVCQGSTGTVTATAGTAGTYSYVWTVPAGASNPGNVDTFTTAVAGIYSVVITNTTTGCVSTSASGTVAFVPSFDFTISEGCVNNNYVLEVIPTSNSFDVNTATFDWHFGTPSVGSNSSTFDVTSYLNSTSVVEQLPLTFSVNVTTIDGCQQSHSITITRIYCDIQRGISPNGDGLNDFFDLESLGVKQLSIYNRYGTKVYTRTDYTNQWIGQADSGNELPDGTYYYVIEFKNNQTSKTGWIYINRETK